jgi:hypothetical protein|tara:strand:- start:3474 stop:3968 length:495 start_codon:yes stop_codon:yes gene_type:complete
LKGGVLESKTKELFMLIKNHYSTDKVDYLRDRTFIKAIKRKEGKAWKKRIKRDFKNACSYNMEDRYANKMHIATTIKTYAKDNRIAFVSGGVDCDGGMWNNNVKIISNPSISKLISIESEFNYYSEGMSWHRYMTVEDAEKLRETSRDLAMESFENGHSHTIRI